LSLRRINDKKRTGVSQSVQEEALPSRVTVEYPRGYDPTRRRYSISSESYSPEQFKDVEAIVIPKSSEEKAQIRATVKGNVLFKHLDADQLDEVANAMARREVAKGVNVVTQGSFVDENEMYLIQEGDCEVLYGQDVVAKLGPGSAFGEIALMYSCPRTATVRTKTACKLWVLDRKSFRRILMQESIRRRDLHQNFLMKVPMLKGLFPYERAKIADSLETEYYKKDDVIIRQGQTDADKFYILEKGEVGVTKADLAGQSPPVFVMTLGPGGYFGELALLRNEPRAATVTASTDVKLLTISREHFSQVLAPCEEILKRHMTDYKSYQDLLASIEGAPTLASSSSLSPSSSSVVAGSTSASIAAAVGAGGEESSSDGDAAYPTTRKEMITYLVDDEADYVFTLTQADGYRRALLEHAASLGIEAATVETVFEGLTEMLQVHTTLEQGLRAASARGEEASVSQLYLDASVRLHELYEKFQKNFGRAQAALSQLSFKPNVAEFLQACEQEAGESIPALFTAIMERVVHLTRSIRHLIGLTPSHHVDAGNLALAVKKVEAVHDALFSQ